MQIKGIIILSVMLVSAVVSEGVMAKSPSVDSDILAEMEALVNKCISVCELKCEKLNSGSKNIRRDAELACIKAKFFQNYKPVLISELVAGNTSAKQYKVHYFLNTRFRDFIKNDQPLISKDSWDNHR